MVVYRTAKMVAPSILCGLLLGCARRLQDTTSHHTAMHCAEVLTLSFLVCRKTRRGVCDVVTAVMPNSWAAEVVLAVGATIWWLLAVLFAAYLAACLVLLRAGQSELA